MAYACKWAQDTSNPSPFTITPYLDICSHPCLQILDVILDDKQWCIINFYHNIQDNLSLQALLALKIDATTPTMVIGNFNTHSPTWSPPDTPHLHWAGCIEEWAVSNLLTLANNPGEIMCKGADHERDLTIDLAWFNEATI
jgi:retrotransposon-encoded endonuclease